MSTATPSRLMTVEELLALPEDESVVRELIEGELREYPMTKRSLKHSAVVANLCFLIKTWQTSVESEGAVAAGEVGAILKRDPDIAVGIDVAWISGELTNSASDTTLIDGPPTLAVEVLSPSDTHQSISEKVDLYLKCGVPLVWVVDPHFQTVTVYRPDQLPEQFNIEQELDGSPALPGFRCSVAAIFR
ncbi:hypothetical protein GC176_11740 [bacterium]|nr:hypothetical protein [bacterium]